MKPDARRLAKWIALLACLSWASVSRAAEFADLLPAIEPAIVYLEAGPAPAAGAPMASTTRGSGVVIRPDGHVLTVDHLVEPDTASLRVRLADGRELPARLVGKDKRSGLAVVRVDVANLAAASVGRSSDLRKAEPVWALGRLARSVSSEVVVTEGVVSLTSYAAPKMRSFIQSTAQFLPSMGGGGLFNRKGELVGINSQIYKQQDGGNAVISFSIPIDEASRIASELIASGRVQRGALGLQIEQVNAATAASLNLPGTKGALVREVKQGGAGQRAGLQPGDILLALNGKDIDEVDDLPYLLGNTRPGDRIRVKIFRRGGYLELNAVADLAQ